MGLEVLNNHVQSSGSIGELGVGVISVGLGVDGRVGVEMVTITVGIGPGGGMIGLDSSTVGLEAICGVVAGGSSGARTGNWNGE